MLRPAHGRVVGVERDAGCPSEESLDRNAGLETGKRRADAEVKTATEREVGGRPAPSRSRCSLAGS